MSDETLKTTPLYEAHVAAGARMVPFAGYSMPVQYKDGVLKEHLWCREHAGLFDVSHMGPSFVTLQTGTEGDAAHAEIAALIEPLISGDIAGLKPGQLRYTLLLNEEGGTRDDLMVGRSPLFGGSLYVIVNAGTKGDDWGHIAAHLGNRAKLTQADDGALLALQGPEAVAVLETLLPGVSSLSFMHYGPFDWQGTRLIVSRSGYTGEDGFEILCAREHAVHLWNTILADPRVKPIGLGARDSLRLEAGLPLYGHDLDDTVSPIEAGLNFAVSKRRREARDFPGASRILTELTGELGRVRVGLFVEGAPAREGAVIVDAEGQGVGRVTSGGFSPSLNRAIALGFVHPQHAAPGTRLRVKVRDRLQPAEITPLPFVPHRYVRKAAS